MVMRIFWIFFVGACGCGSGRDDVSLPKACIVF